MRMTTSLIIAGVVCACVTDARADVLNMGPGLTSLETVSVGNLGNAGEWSGASYGGYGPDRICGAVDYAYDIGRYEITSGQYTEFLNAVASDDTYGLYNPSMWLDSMGCQIQRGGSPGSWTYSVASEWANRPVNYVSWGSAARFCNWLRNGQPIGAQGGSTTEDGSYALNGATGLALLDVARAPDATWVIPSEDEWYKAAYYKGGGTDTGYWDFATQCDTPPTPEGPPGTNMECGSANYDEAVGHTTDVGAYSAKPSVSAYGTFDQCGNVWERVETLQGEFQPMHGVRGGGYGSGATESAAAARYASDDSYAWVGFRVALVPEPTALALLAAGVALIGRPR